MKTVHSAEVSSEVLASEPNVFAYLDFRKYLNDYCEYRRTSKYGWSISSFARRAGVSRSLFHAVLSGERNLSGHRIPLVGQACELEGEAHRYFVALVLWNQCTDENSREMLWDKVRGLAPRETYYDIKSAEQRIAGRWYFIAILELARTSAFQPTGEWISSRLRGLVSPMEAQSTWQSLIDLNFVKKKCDGMWTVSHNVVVGAASQISSETIREHHRKMMALAVRAMKDVERSQRDLGALTLGVPHDQVEALKEKVTRFQKELLDFAESFKNVDDVYQFNFQLFPLTEIKSTDERGSK